MFVICRYQTKETSKQGTNWGQLYKNFTVSKFFAYLLPDHLKFLCDLFKLFQVWLDEAEQLTKREHDYSFILADVSAVVNWKRFFINVEYIVVCNNNTLFHVKCHNLKVHSYSTVDKTLNSNTASHWIECWF